MNEEHENYQLLTQPIKYSGGKYYLAPKIISLMPKHIHYVEPYFGGGAVLLRRNPEDPHFWVAPHKGVSEVANDIDGDLMNFWTVLRDREYFAEFKRTVECMPFSRILFDWLKIDFAYGYSDPVTRAVVFFVLARQSRAGGMEDFTPLTRTRLRRGMNGNVSEWLGAIEGLADVHARLQRVIVENMSALDLITREDTVNTLFYLDPTYLPETKKAKIYKHEMTYQDHVDLLCLINNVKGKVMLSGYDSPLYRDRLKHWNVARFDIANHMSGAKSKDCETEYLWMNY